MPSPLQIHPNIPNQQYMLTNQQSCNLNIPETLLLSGWTQGCGQQTKLFFGAWAQPHCLDGSMVCMYFCHGPTRDEVALRQQQRTHGTRSKAPMCPGVTLKLKVEPWQVKMLAAARGKRKMREAVLLAEERRTQPLSNMGGGLCRFDRTCTPVKILLNL